MTQFLNTYVRPYRKAIVATLLSFLGALYTASADNSITLQEWLGVALTTLGSGGGTYVVKNRRRRPQPY